MEKTINDKYFEDYVDYIGDRNYYESMSDEMQRDYKVWMLESVGYVSYLLRREIEKLVEEFLDAFNRMLTRFRKNSERKKRQKRKRIKHTRILHLRTWRKS